MRNPPATRWLAHIAFWLLYVLLEYLADYPHLEGAEHWNQIRAVLLALPIIVIPTYLVVLVLVPKLLQGSNWLFFVISLIALAALVYYGRLKWFSLVNYLNHDHFFDMPASKIIKNVIRDYSVIALAICIYIIGDWRRKEKLNQELIETKARLDLELLKRQLHPHFLFNTLNNIYSLALKKSDDVEKSILKLSDLLEYLVYQSGEDSVALVQELELVKNYIALEQLRYGNELSIELDVKDVREELRTPPLILLPFVENCFKHGGPNEKGKFWIKFKISTFEKILKVHCSNSKGNKRHDPAKSGLGLANMRQRLDMLFPDKYRLKVEDSDEFYSIDLELDVNR